MDTEKRTYEMPREKLEGLEVLAEGYKAIEYDGGTKGDFMYGEKGDTLIGRVFAVDGDLSECKWGLHFSRDPAYVFNFYEPLGYNRYFKIRAYGKILETEDGMKTVAKIIEFAEEYDLMQFIETIKAFNRSSYGVSRSYGVSESRGVSRSRGVSVSCGVSRSCGVSESYGITSCKAAYNSAFCAGKTGISSYLFNRKSSEKRCKEVIGRLRGFDWFPKFHNMYDLKGNMEWWRVCFPELVDVEPKEAWSKMPREILDYIRSLPEFDAKVFEKVTFGAFPANEEKE